MVIDPGGPVLVEGPVEVDLGNGRTAASDRFVVALCACRRSRDYPWCDTSHRRRPRPRRNEARREEPDGDCVQPASPGPGPAPASNPSSNPSSSPESGPASNLSSNPARFSQTAPSSGALTVGVEEEFLLVDAVSGRCVASAGEVLEAAGDGPRLPDGAHVKPELLASQVELTSGICGDLPALAEQLGAGRRLLAEAARRRGRTLVSAGTPVLESGSATLTTGARYEQMGHLHAGLLTDYEACGCHVHVGVADTETAVAVINHLRPWLPSLLALSANSPFHAGRDTGYASWRMVLQSRFPGSGVPPYFPSAAAYHEQLEQLVDCGTLADVRQSFWLVRPSPSFPTVEFRVADAATAVDEAAVQAALSRALVRTALRELSEGREPARVPDQIAAAAVWSAARHGLDGPGVHPRRARKVPAADLVHELLDHLTPALEESGDLEYVRILLRRLLAGGTGARRQRDAAAGGPAAVVAQLADETVRPPDVIRPCGGTRTPSPALSAMSMPRRTP